MSIAFCGGCNSDRPAGLLLYAPGWDSEMTDAEFQTHVLGVGDRAKQGDQERFGALCYIASIADTSRHEFIQDVLIRIYENDGRDSFLARLRNHPIKAIVSTVLVDIAQYYGRRELELACSELGISMSSLDVDVGSLDK